MGLDRDWIVILAELGFAWGVLYSFRGFRAFRRYRVIFTKGKNAPAFAVSWRSENDIEGMLRKRALKYIFGGAGLAIVCLAFLLAKFGWLF